MQTSAKHEAARKLTSAVGEIRRRTNQFITAALELAAEALRPPVPTEGQEVELAGAYKAGMQAQFDALKGPMEAAEERISELDEQLSAERGRSRLNKKDRKNIRELLEEVATACDRDFGDVGEGVNEALMSAQAAIDALVVDEQREDGAK